MSQLSRVVSEDYYSRFAGRYRVFERVAEDTVAARDIVRDKLVEHEERPEKVEELMKTLADLDRKLDAHDCILYDARTTDYDVWTLSKYGGLYTVECNNEGIPHPFTTLIEAVLYLIEHGCSFI